MLRLKGISKQNKTVIINMFGAFAVKGMSLLLALFTMPAYMKFFQNQMILGVWFTILSVLNWLFYFDLGLGHGLRNMLPKAIENKDFRCIKELISTTYITMIILVVFLAILGWLVIPIFNWNQLFNINSNIIDNSVLNRTVSIVYFGILLQFVVKLVSSVLYALQKSAVVNLMSLISSTIIVLALVILPSSTIDENLFVMSVVNVVAMTIPYILVSFWVYVKLLENSFPRLSWFNKIYINDITKIGLSLLWLQIVFMIISSTNEFLISYTTSPNYVVEYQAYHKIFKTGGMLFSLALVPIWSAVTKAQANDDFRWIKKTYVIFLRASVICFIVELSIIPFLQSIMDIWLGQNSFKISFFVGFLFAVSNTVFIVHNINTAISNGISYFKIQMIWMTIAAAIFIPLCYFMVKITNSWVGIVIANTMALIPYEILAPIYTFKRLDDSIKRNNSI